MPMSSALATTAPLKFQPPPSTDLPDIQSPHSFFLFQTTMTAPEVSHGRGGAGNINPDDTQYVDGEIVRAGTPGSQGAGAFSTGRGGTFVLSTSGDHPGGVHCISCAADTAPIEGLSARNTSKQGKDCCATSVSARGGGNIGDKGIDPTTRKDEDLVPEAAVRPSEDEDVHTGRGGAGNVHLGPEHKKKRVIDGVQHDEASTAHSSVADKLKHKVLGVFKK
ncbi:hypothetical protein SUNI508_07303 [Seiridium unicorne]|uniref:Uncharacterized protein n=1 Tax=Seiridium unicorne TaxID=138068 RepID=A0ABR2UY76_9PEZI